MMCLKLPDTDAVPHCSSCSKPLDTTAPSFTEAMMSLAVKDKPTIEQLGGAATPAPKSFRRRSIVGSSSGSSSITVFRGTSLPGLTIPPSETPSRKRSLSTGPASPSSKRRRLSRASSAQDCLMSTPSEDRPLSYAEKQYHSVWLAVPPESESKTTSRPPPRRRSSNGSIADSKKTPRSKTPSKKKKISFAGQRLTTTTSNAKLPFDKNTLRKQRADSYPRDRPHYYNKVVRRKGSKSNQFYFVYHYDEQAATLRLIPLEVKGTLSGNREGRPRYRAVLGDTDRNFRTVASSSYEVMTAYAVMKSPWLVTEAWDIVL